jgi:synaptosomal-associated protein 29
MPSFSIFGKKKDKHLSQSQTQQQKQQQVEASGPTKLTNKQEWDIKMNKKIVNDDSFRINDSVGTKEESQDLEQIHAKIDSTENESLESTRRALRMLNETEEVGVKTADELVMQGEQLKRVEGNLDEVDQTLKESEKAIKQINSNFVTGYMRAIFKGDSKKSNTTAKKDESMFVKTTTPQTKTTVGSAFSSQSQSKPTQASVITGSDREKEMNENLDAMSSGLARLQMLSLDMGREIDSQAPSINRIQNKVDNNQAKITSQNTAMTKQLK